MTKRKATDDKPYLITPHDGHWHWAQLPYGGKEGKTRTRRGAIYKAQRAAGIRPWWRFW